MYPPNIFDNVDYGVWHRHCVGALLSRALNITCFYLLYMGGAILSKHSKKKKQHLS